MASFDIMLMVIEAEKMERIHVKRSIVTKKSKRVTMFWENWSQRKEKIEKLWEKLESPKRRDRKVITMRLKKLKSPKLLEKRSNAFGKTQSSPNCMNIKRLGVRPHERGAVQGEGTPGKRSKKIRLATKTDGNLSNTMKSGVESEWCRFYGRAAFFSARFLYKNWLSKLSRCICNKTSLENFMTTKRLQSCTAVIAPIAHVPDVTAICRRQ